MDPVLVMAGTVIHALGVLALADPTVKAIVQEHAKQQGFGAELAKLIEAIALPKDS